MSLTLDAMETVRKGLLCISSHKEITAVILCSNPQAIPYVAKIVSLER